MCLVYEVLKSSQFFFKYVKLQSCRCDSDSVPDQENICWTKWQCLVCTMVDTDKYLVVILSDYHYHSTILLICNEDRKWNLVFEGLKTNAGRVTGCVVRFPSKHKNISIGAAGSDQIVAMSVAGNHFPLADGKSTLF